MIPDSTFPLTASPKAIFLKTSEIHILKGASKDRVGFSNLSIYQVI